jgi:Dolichyl-phosphate-mannose-protein mannosyltransferase
MGFHSSTYLRVGVVGESAGLNLKRGVSRTNMPGPGTPLRFFWVSTAETANNSHDLRNVALLCVIGLLSRLLFLGIGEPDSALFVVGVRQWLRGGPRSPIIYSGAACGGYYAAIAGTIRHLHLGEENAAALMSIVSAIACLIILTTAYSLGRRFVGSENALEAMLLFCFSPGLWWSTIQPHPEAISLAFALLGIWSFVRVLEGGRVWRAFLSAMFFGLAISLKNDAVLLVPVLYGFSLLCGIWRRNFVTASAVIGLAGAIALFLGRLATGPSSEDVIASAHAVGTYFGIPAAMELVKQLLPIGFGFGLVTLAGIIFLVPGALRLSPDRNRWLIVLGSWCLFWISILDVYQGQ